MMAQRLTLEIDLTNEDSDSGDTNVSSQAHPPPISLPITTTAVVESSTTTTTNVSGIANCCGDSNITAENVCQMATTSAAAAAAQNQNQNQSSDNNALEEGATGFDNNRDVLECPICLQTCIHPARLPCGHIFCFLCVKGVAYKNRRCAMCRREIPVEFLDFPQLVNGIKDICATTATDDGYQWFYEGRNGWWQYDDRTSQDIEDAYRKGERTITILVAGYVYTVDFENMMQLRQNEPTRCRRVKRDLATIPKKGVAGLRIEGNTVTTDSNFADYVADTQLLNSTDGTSSDGFWDVEGLSDELEAEANDNSNNADIDDDDDDDDFEYVHELGRPYMNFQRLQSFLEFGNNNVPRERVLGTFMSNMAVGHAIRMANDIIGSTLAHADEFTYLELQNGVTTTTTGTTGTTTAATTTTTTATTTAVDTTNLTHRRLPPICDDGEQTTTTTTNTSWPTMSRNSIDSLPSGSGLNLVSSNSGRTLPTVTASAATTTANRQNLIAQAVAAAAANHQAIDMFEQTLNNFNALSLHNIVDSSDDNDDDHIVTTTTTQSISSTTTTTTFTNTNTTTTTITTTTPSSSSSSSNEPHDNDNTPVYRLTLRF